MLLSLLWLLSFQGDFYYLDGHAFHLRSGLIVKTVAEVKENPLFYTWQEGDAFVTLEKRNVRTVEFFSLQVPGRKPKSFLKGSTRRRISGMPVTFTNSKGDLELKTRHINQRGRSMEGQVVPNHVDRLIMQEGSGGAAFTAILDRSTLGSQLEMRFYDLSGGLEAKAFLDVTDVENRTDLRRQSKQLHWEFSLSQAIDVKKIGLVEVITLGD